ncbi:MAG: ribosome small subunit-dependent GTPase A [Clostridia bacterium]|nr:ribosome small subunit-dependent GTPase A [Clostridia bacterium]
MTEKNELYGKIISCVGGLYTVQKTGGERVCARARGSFRYNKSTPLAGDNVFLHKENDSFAINKIAERKNSLIRPPIANLDTLFVSFAPIEPMPNILCIDKLLCVAAAAKINAAVVITKSDLSAELAEKYAEIYRKAGYPVFITSSVGGEGIGKVREYIAEGGAGKTYAFAGASGIGKSSIMNALFPELALKTGSLSEKISRGKQTTRTVELFPVPVAEGGKDTVFVADTPGFSVLEFSAIAGFGKKDLAATFPEFSRYACDCRWRDCTHTKDDGCGITEAVERGDIAKERHESFLALYEELSQIPEWK